MYESQFIAERIRGRAKSVGVTQKALLESAGLGRNTMAHLDGGKAMASDSLGRVADFLDCSVDFLLGRTEVVAVGAMPDGAVVLSDDELVLLDRYRSLTGGGKEIVRSRALEQLQIENLSRGNGESAASAG